MSLWMALTLFGEWVGSAFVDNLVGKMWSSSLLKYPTKTDDSRELLDKLQEDKLKLIHVMERGRQVDTKKRSLIGMMDDICDAVYEAEDIQDRFSYRARKKKVCDCSSLDSVVSVEDLNELKRIGGRVSNIVKNLPFCLKALKSEEKLKKTQDWRQTTSISNEPNLFGRTREKNYLKMLLQYIHEEDLLKYRVIGLCGIGGIGKTTLAQSIYSDQNIINTFDLMEWIYVSEKFDVRKLTIQIIQSASKKKYNFHRHKQLEDLQKIVSMKLYNKKVLIVFDDVLNENMASWGNLIKPLRYAKPGSKIIVTTRNKNVLTLMGAKEVIELNGLDDENYWQLLSQCAFEDQNPKNYPKLQTMLKQIMMKLSGSPLAAKTIGGTLKSKLEDDHWREILNSRLWQLDQKDDGIFAVLKLSFKRLPKHLQQCFGYCAMFPKDYLYKKETLIHLWITQDFIQLENTSKTLEDVGAEYFNELLNWSYFQKAAGVVDRYVIPNLLHDIAESVSNGEYFRIEDNYHVKIPKKVRHLFTTTKNALKIFDEPNELKKLRSLVIEYDPDPPWRNCCIVIEEIIKNAIALRVLILPSIPGILTTPINHLIHLRYLDVRYKTASDLKNSISQLFHLQFLNVNVEQKTDTMLLKEVNKLTNLRCLKAPPEIIRSIPSIGELSDLQVLTEFELREETGFGVGQLKKLNGLKESLCIKNLEKAKTEDTKLAKLENKEKIKSLSLEWNTEMEESDMKIENQVNQKKEMKIEKHENVLEGLRPNPNLRNIQITRYIGRKPPYWLKHVSLPNLEQINLINCKNLENIPSFGEFPYLKILHIGSMNGLKQINSHFYGGKENVAFPHLEELIMENLGELEQWAGPEIGQESFPRLRKLTILNCEKLKGPLPLPSTQNKMHIMVVKGPHSLTPSNSLNTDSKFELTIDRFWSLHKYIPQTVLDRVQLLDISSDLPIRFIHEQERWFEQLTSLEKLRFSFCANLTGLPSSLKSLSNLVSLHLEKCLDLIFLPEEGLPLNLKELEIVTCNKRLGRHCRPGSGKNWPKISHVKRITIDGHDFREKIQRGIY